MEISPFASIVPEISPVVNRNRQPRSTSPEGAGEMTMNNDPMQGHTTTRSERRDSIQNRQRLLATARRLFAEQGADETSMNQIAQAAGVGPGTLYRHFAHKGVLCAALLSEDFAAFQERVTAL